MKKKILTLLILSFVGLGVGYVLTNSYDFGICYRDIETNTSDVSCHLSYERLGDPIFYGMGALSIVFLALLFAKKSFRAWKKFAIWFVPLATLLFIFYPDPGSGDYFSPAPEQLFQWVSILYIIISLIIITISRLKNKNH
jgi:hypothetical protein